MFFREEEGKGMKRRKGKSKGRSLRTLKTGGKTKRRTGALLREQKREEGHRIKEGLPVVGRDPSQKKSFWKVRGTKKKTGGAVLGGFQGSSDV